jgi:hypothetical protein
LAVVFMGIGLPPSMWFSLDGEMCGTTCADAEHDTAATADVVVDVDVEVGAEVGESFVVASPVDALDVGAEAATAPVLDDDATTDDLGSEEMFSFPLHAIVAAPPARSDAPTASNARTDGSAQRRAEGTSARASRGAAANGVALDVFRRMLASYRHVARAWRRSARARAITRKNKREMKAARRPARALSVVSPRSIDASIDVGSEPEEPADVEVDVRRDGRLVLRDRER